LDSRDEHQIVKDCLKGNRESQRALYEKYKVPMFRLCLRYAGDHAEAEDILQDGFIKVFNDLHQFGFRGVFGGWLRKVVLNVALQHVRKKSRMNPVVETDSLVNQLHTDENILSELHAETLTKLIQTLPPGYRAVFNLYVVEGYSHQEIGELLGIEEGTSKSQLSKSKAALRAMIENIMMT
jgi:RNA polymerase sigma factor (sigma-70 family)